MAAYMAMAGCETPGRTCLVLPIYVAAQRRPSSSAVRDMSKLESRGPPNKLASSHPAVREKTSWKKIGAGRIRPSIFAA